jgi:hypothetical protein
MELVLADHQPLCPPVDEEGGDTALRALLAVGERDYDEEVGACGIPDPELRTVEKPAAVPPARGRLDGRGV